MYERIMARVVSQQCYLRARDQVIDHLITLYLGFTDCNVLPTILYLWKKTAFTLDLSSIRTVCDTQD